MTPDDLALETLIRSRLSARGMFENEELVGAVAEAVRLAHDVASLRSVLCPGDCPDRLLHAVGLARADGH